MEETTGGSSVYSVFSGAEVRSVGPIELGAVGPYILILLGHVHRLHRLLLCGSWVRYTYASP